MSNTEAEKYEVLERIGQGSFGIIRKVRRKNDGLVLCRKEICYSKMSQKEREQLQAELDILKRLNHPNIVRYYEREHHKASHDLHLYMEYCGNGDLGIMIKDLKARHAYADEEFVWTIFGQIVSALYLCHYGEDPPHANGNAVGLARNALPLKSKQQAHHMILHRDLKPENVFLGEGNSVKLGDFGLSKIILSHDFASTYVGTPFYMSPEICAAERYSLFSDIWSLGCIIYELCAKEPPFNAKTHFDLIQKIKLGKVAPLPRQYSRELQDVISACLQVNPNARPDTVSLLNLPRVKLVRKSQQNALMLQQHVVARDRALEELKIVKEQMANLEMERQTEKQTMHDQIDQKLRLEWETRATLEINRRVRLAEEKLEQVFLQRVEEEVEKRQMLSLPSSYTSSHASSTNSGGEHIADPIPRSSTPEAALGEHVPSLGTVGEVDEDESPSTDLTSLSLEDSPLVQRHKPLKKTSRTPFTRARTFANATEVAASPMDIHMADPSPMSIKCLSLSPRRTFAAEGSKLRQPALRGVNIFDKAAMRETGAPLFPTADDDEHDAGSDNDDESASPIRGIKLAPAGADPFKVLASQPSMRPSMMRQKTMPVNMHARLKSTPNLYGLGCASGRTTPTSTTNSLPIATASSMPTTSGSATLAATAATTDRPTSRTSSRTPSPQRKSALLTKPSLSTVSPSRKAPPPPAQPSLTALSSAGKKGAAAAAVLGKDDMVKAMHRNNLQGRTLVELAQARGIPVTQQQQQQQFQQGFGGSAGAGMGMGVDEEKVALGAKVAARFMEPPMWDPERDEMPSPFLIKTRRIAVSR